MIDYLDDLESDFSRFHRIDDIYELDGPRFMRLAWRISVYGGVMALRVQNQEPATETAAPTPAVAAPGTGHSNVVDLAAFTAMHTGLIDRKKVDP